MELANFTYFILGAFSLALGFIIKPYVDMVVMRLKRVFTRKKRTEQPDCRLMEHNIEELVERMNELQEQMNNVAKNSYRRETNRKNNIRREVRDYLAELRSDK
jgi:Na+/phosphate symporter